MTKSFLIAVVILATVFVSSGCGNGGSPGAPVPEEGVFTVLDPRGWTPERPVEPLSPRLDTLEGKRIGLMDTARGKEILEVIGTELENTFPGLTTGHFSTGIADLTPEQLAAIENSYDAVIISRNY